MSKEKKKNTETRVYHVNKRAADGKWTIKRVNYDKVIKTFDTKEEAMLYAKKLSKKHDGTLLVHASKGEKKGKIAKQGRDTLK